VAGAAERGLELVFGSSHLRGDPAPVRVVAGVPYPEGPSFDRDGKLFVCVRRDGYIVRVDSSGSVTRFLTTGYQPNGTRFHRDGRLFVAEIKLCQILEVFPDGSSQVFLDRFGDDPLIGPNDLIFDRHGVLYFTDPGESSIDNPIGCVYRVTPDKDVARVATGLAYPNGIALPADESALFVAESRTNRVLRLSLDRAGRAGKPEIFCELTGGLGPDGMAFGMDQNLYVTNHGAGTIDVVDPNGKIAVRLPAGGPGPTNCAFWGTALYVTEDESASVWKLELGVAGLLLFHQR
jgi:gluconolactonase